MCLILRWQYIHFNIKIFYVYIKCGYLMFGGDKSPLLLCFSDLVIKEIKCYY